LFPENKSMLKGRKFEETKIVTNKLLAWSENEFEECFQQFYGRAQSCKILLDMFDSKCGFLEMYSPGCYLSNQRIKILNRLKGK
jgi:hypothetical protein